MDRLEHLGSLFEQWRALSQAEAQGIGSGNWPQVSGSQQAKQQLQDEIVQASRALCGETPASGPPAEPLAGSLRQRVAELIALEEHNLALVTRQIREAERQRETLQRARQTLRRMHQAYGSRRSPGWVGYS